MGIAAFLVDDHELVREGLRAVLERERDIVVCGESTTAATALPLIEATGPDVVLLELRLPDGDGIELCRALKNCRPEVACLIFASDPGDELLLAAIRADVAGFLRKRVAAADLVAAVRRVAAGGSLIDPAISRRLLQRLRDGPVGGPDPTVLDRLSPQETKLLDHMALGLTNRQIAVRMGLAEKTVKNYASNVLRKLGMSSRTEAAVFMANVRSDAARPRLHRAGLEAVV